MCLEHDTKSSILLLLFTALITPGDHVTRTKQTKKKKKKEK